MDRGWRIDVRGNVGGSESGTHLEVTDALGSSSIALRDRATAATTRAIQLWSGVLRLETSPSFKIVKMGSQCRLALSDKSHSDVLATLGVLG